MADNKLEAATGGAQDATPDASSCSWARAAELKDKAIFYVKWVPLVNFFAFLLVSPIDADDVMEQVRGPPAIGRQPGVALAWRRCTGDGKASSRPQSTTLSC